ncbi:MAG: dihydrodipicolinate synthase family protein [Paracoccaceae bacterium]
MNNLNGIIAPILTPFESNGTIADDLWVAHAKWVLGQGAHYLSPFGTTGEALSVPVADRMKALECLTAAGIAPALLMPGTGLTSLSETISLTRHAVDLGVRATMILPSFFYTDAGDDGQFRYFAALVNGVADENLKICLYNIPKYSGVSISAGLANRLHQEFPTVFVAFKDSTGNWDNTLAVINEATDIAVFPGTEVLLAKAMQAGGAGCISAMVNLNARAMRSTFDDLTDNREVSARLAELNQFRETIQNGGLIPALKSILAVWYDDPRWLNLRPPLQDGSFELGRELLARLGPLADDIIKPV